MAGGRKRDFSTVPVRIFNDPRPSALDFRTLACVSMHDGMSLKKGTGRGCYATFATLTDEIGCDASNLSNSLKRLVEWGYLSVERQDDRRRKTYRVIFEDEESWRNGQQTGAQKVSETAENSRSDRSEIVGQRESKNGRNPPQTEQHYSSLKGLDFSKEKLNSAKAARFAGSEKMVFAENVGAQLAQLERALAAGEPVNLVEWYEYVGNAWEHDEHRHRADRLSEALWALMTPEQLEQCCRY